MNKTTANIIKIATVLAALAAVVILIVVYKDKIMAFINSVKEKINDRRQKLVECNDFSDFADV